MSKKVFLHGMKRLFPIIITLTIISLIGIIVLQIQWISSAIRLKQDQYEQSVQTALESVKDSIVFRKESGVGFMNNARTESKKDVSTPNILTRPEIKYLIRTELQYNGIKQKFEYNIINEAAAPIMYSAGFRTEYLDDPSLFKINISGRTSSTFETLFVYILQPQKYFMNQLLFMLIGAIIFTSIIIAAFFLTIRTMLTQRKLSEIKSDFINNMTHEFKTPIATIQLASDALRNDKVIQNPEEIMNYTSIIKEENRRMHKQVERILNAAQLEKDDVKLQLKELDVHAIIEKLIENTQLRAEEINATLHKELLASNYIIKADEVHFSNIIFNLMDNALKYAKENPEVTVRTENFGQSLHIKFIDNGIGMTKETVNNIFEKFYRAHTGNKHNVKGFGLGLTYVKNIIDLHEAKISVDSKIDQGSVFTIIFPINQA